MNKKLIIGIAVFLIIAVVGGFVFVNKAQSKEEFIIYEAQLVQDAIRVHFIDNEGIMPDGVAIYNAAKLQLLVADNMVYDTGGKVAKLKSDKYYDITSTKLVTDLDLDGEGTYIMDEDYNVLYIEPVIIDEGGDFTNPPKKATNTFKDKITVEKEKQEDVDPLMNEIMELLETLNDNYEDMVEEARVDNGDGSYTVRLDGYTFPYEKMLEATEQLKVLDENGIILKPRHIEYTDMTDSSLLDKYDIQLEGRVILGDTFTAEEFFYINDNSLIEGWKDKDKEIETREGFEYIEIENGIEIIGIDPDVEFDGKVTIPETIDNKPVVSIGDDAFNFEDYDILDKRGYETEKEERVGKVKEVVLPDGLESIGDYAFANNKIKEITVPDTVKDIGYRAFYNNFLIVVDFDGKVDNIGEDVFYLNTEHDVRENIDGDYSGKWIFGEYGRWERPDNNGPETASDPDIDYSRWTNRPDTSVDYSDYEWIDINHFYSEATPAPYTTVAIRDNGIEVIRGKDTSKYMFIATPTDLYRYSGGDSGYTSFKESFVISGKLLTLKDVEYGKMINYGEIVIPLDNGLNLSSANPDIAKFIDMMYYRPQDFSYKSYLVYEKKDFSNTVRTLDHPDCFIYEEVKKGVVVTGYNNEIKKCYQDPSLLAKITVPYEIHGHDVLGYLNGAFSDLTIKSIIASYPMHPDPLTVKEFNSLR